MQLQIFLVMLILLNPMLSLKAGDSVLKLSPLERLVRASNSDALDPHALLEIIEGQLSALRTGDIPKAYNEFTSIEFRKITSQQQFAQFVKTFPVLSTNRSVKFNSVNFEKSIATFEGTLISQNGETLEAEYDLIQEKGKWRILGIQLFNPETTNLRPNQT